MIIIKVKQEPGPDWPDGWAIFEYQDETVALEHWHYLAAEGSEAQWIDDDEPYQLLTNYGGKI